MIDRIGKLSHLAHRELKSRSGEAFSHSAVLTDILGFKDIFVHHEILPPGRHASSPHFHSHQEEMIVVLKGKPTVHLGSNQAQLEPGDFVGFRPGSKELHFLENKTQEEAHVLVISSRSGDDRVQYSTSKGSAPEFRITVRDSIYISDITAADKPAYLEHLKEKQIYDQTLNIPYPYTEADADWWINHVAKTTLQQGRSVNWAIRRDDGFLIGGIGYHDFKLGKSHKAELGYWLAKPYWGQGIMTEAVKKIAAFGFEELSLVRITANVFHFNMGSARVLEKAGFQLEGVLCKHYKKDGKIFDGRLYAMTRKGI